MAIENSKLIYNARIYISGQVDHSWMIIDPATGYVLRIDRDEAPLAEFVEHAKINMGGKRILPGFHESHIHVSYLGAALDSVLLHGSKSIEEFQMKIGEYCRNRPEKLWIRGMGWEQDLMGRWPTKEDVDAVCQDRPACLARSCGHLLVMNSTAMELLGLSPSTPDPPGGAFDRYPSNHPRNGELTGVARETARDLVIANVPLTSEDKQQYITTAIDKLLACGVTSAHALEGDTWQEYCDKADQEDLPVRIFYSAYFNDDRKGGNFPRFAGETRGDFLSCDRIKLFTDGSLGGATAALSQTYRNSDNRGILIHKQDKLNALVHEATSLGYRLEFHVIGDAAAEAALDAMEHAQVAPEKRPLLTHCQFLRDDLIERMKERGCIANIQPQFVPTDAALAEEIIPEDLLAWSYPWKTLLERGVRCAGGSDAPVEPPQPMLGIYDAIYRPHGRRQVPQTKQFRPEECLNVQQAIDLYTRDGAYATLKEHILGQLLPGYLADFVVISSDTDVVDHPEQFLTAKVAETWIAGSRKF